MPEIACNGLAVKSRLKGEPAVYQIAGVPGLHLAVLGEGRGSWRIRYRPRRGAEKRWYTIGDARTIELGDAIRKAKDLLAALQLDGIDPHAEADRQSAAQLTFEDAYKEWLDHPGREKKLRARTRDEYERIFKTHIKDRIGSVRFSGLDKAAVKSALEEIREATVDDDRGHRGLQATKALALIRAVCRYGASKNYSDRDPTLGVARPVPVSHPDGKQNRPPTNDELRALWRGAEGSHKESKRAFMEPQTQRAFKLSILLGKRISELLGARKSEVEFGRNANLFIPGTREGNKAREDQRVPLPSLAQKLLKEAMAVNDKSPFVFPVTKTLRRR